MASTSNIVMTEELSDAWFECSVCLEQVPWDNGIQLEKCHHVYCKECMRGYVSSQVSDKTVELPCPDSNCHWPLECNDVRRSTLEVGDSKIWQEYEELATQVFLDKAASSSKTTTYSGTCRCPAEKCNYIFHFEPDPKNGTLFLCPVCHSAFCLSCPVVDHKAGPAHEGGCQRVLREMIQSAEMREKLEDWKRLNSQADSRLTELLEKERVGQITKPCPHCATPITKNGGCDHMRCKNCDTKFNWSQA
ncbi:protein ligase RNF19B [Seminavis robusta]|uniref:RBR-type E3 ubiquitin transferase n=1 Tax=Seminavis robusta TaxID=568900 RepID=A0A9N8ER69_9STRA|nr:protein ligase RNF19B [Seminavis robusta]|eukprot:Sro1484_g276460.1 protein ligase RNF19B (248) ;mRNA; f:16439-17182